MVVLTHEKYEIKVNNFLQDNNFTVINNNPTQHYKKPVKQALKQCNIIQKEPIWRYRNINPFPNIQAIIESHKQSKHIKKLTTGKRTSI
jgi:hypothetical protein